VAVSTGRCGVLRERYRARALAPAPLNPARRPGPGRRRPISQPGPRPAGTRPAAAGSDRAGRARSGRPSRDANCRVVFQIPRADDPMAAAPDRAAPLKPRLPRIVAGEELGRAGLATVGLAAGAHQHREQALDGFERPGRGPAERIVRPPAPLVLEHSFERIAGQPGPMNRPNSHGQVGERAGHWPMGGRANGL
jgi:hypothetical protein